MNGALGPKGRCGGRVVALVALASGFVLASCSEEEKHDDSVAISDVCALFPEVNDATLNQVHEAYISVGWGKSRPRGAFGNGPGNQASCEWKAGVDVQLVVAPTDEGLEDMEKVPFQRGITLIDEFGEPSYLFGLDNDFGLLRIRCNGQADCDTSDEVILNLISAIKTRYPDGGE